MLALEFFGLMSGAGAEIKRITSGNENAKITIIAYESLTCSHCADFHKDVYPKLKKDYIDTGLVKIEFRHFPLDVAAFNAAKIREDAPFDKVCYIGCGVTTGIGAVLNTAKVEQGSRAIVFGLGGIGLNVIQGLRMAGCDQIVGVDLNPSKVEMAKKFGMTDFVNPSEVKDEMVPYLVNLTKGGADYTFDATGNVDVMRTALESAHKGWGESIIIGVAPAGAEISTRPFQLVTGRSWRGTAFGGARGRTDVPKIVDWYMDGKIEIDPMITHKMPLEDINRAFDLMHKGESIRSVIEY